MYSLKSSWIVVIVFILLGTAVSTCAHAADYYYLGINEGYYRNAEDGRPWLQAGTGYRIQTGFVEAAIVYLGNDSHYESSRSKGISVSYLFQSGSFYGRLGLLGYKNIWHTYVPPEQGSDSYREENTSGMNPLMGAGWRHRHLGLEIVYYHNAGRLAGSATTGFVTGNINYFF